MPGPRVYGRWLLVGRLSPPPPAGGAPSQRGPRGAAGKWGLLQLCQRGLGIVEDALELLEGGVHGGRGGQVNTGVA